MFTDAPFHLPHPRSPRVPGGPLRTTCWSEISSGYDRVKGPVRARIGALGKINKYPEVEHKGCENSALPVFYLLGEPAGEEGVKVFSIKPHKALQILSVEDLSLIFLLCQF